MSAEALRNTPEKEQQLIKAVITEEILKSIRGLFLGLETTEQEKRIIHDLCMDEEVYNIFARRLYPHMDKNTPIGQVQDSWLGAESMVFNAPTDTITQALEYKDLALQYTKQALSLLKDPNGKPVNLAYAPASYPEDRLGIMLLARNQFIRHVEQQLLFVWLIAQQKVEAPEVVEKKKKQNSAK